MGIDTEASTMEIGGSRLCDNALAQIDGTYTDSRQLHHRDL